MGTINMRSIQAPSAQQAHNKKKSIYNRPHPRPGAAAVPERQLLTEYYQTFLPHGYWDERSRHATHTTYRALLLLTFVSRGWNNRSKHAKTLKNGTFVLKFPRFQATSFTSEERDSRSIIIIIKSKSS
jgi:hypothetical protein